MKLNLLEKAKKLSIDKGQPILVSMVNQINMLDPLAFFEAGKRFFNGNRNFWSDPEEELILVGLGSMYSIQTDSPNRYQQVEKEWQAFLKNVFPESLNNPMGTGPLLIGGFSFDPLKEKTMLWKQFEETMLMLPKFMLTISKGEAYLTINEFVSEHTNTEETTRQLTYIEENLISDAFKILIPTSNLNTQIEAIEIEPEKWKQAVTNLAKEVREGVLEKVVLARELRLRSEDSFSPYSTLYHLREEQAHSYLFAIEKGADCFLGATPERLIKKTGDEMLSTCLAGSIKRGETPAEDERLGNWLLQDSKNLHEHGLVVKMISIAMEQVCQTVEIPHHPVLIKLRNIQHLYTPVKGKAKTDSLILDMVNLLHPTPALGGYPKEIAMKKIRDEELLDRGWYAGAVGWLDARGNGEFAVAIRSGLLQGKEASLFAGCGIVGDSNPESEYQETIIKFKPMLSALGGNLKWHQQVH